MEASRGSDYLPDTASQGEGTTSWSPHLFPRASVPATTWRRWALLAVLLHGILAFAFSVLIPPWEAHDEWAHYKYVEYVARYKRLPPQDRRLTEEFAYDEATQPPLYYILAAIPVALVLPHDAYTPEVNPYATSEFGQGGRNMVLHDPHEEAFPWRGTILALHVARWVSVVIGTLGLWFTWRLALLLSRRESIATWALIFHALVPQYIFIGSVVTNDILLAVLTVAAVYFMSRLLLSPTTADALALGGVLLLAMLTKYLALALIPPAIILYAAVLTRSRSSRVRRGVPIVVGLLVFLIGGAWMHYNLRHTGTLFPRDPYAFTVIVTTSPRELLTQLPWDHLPSMLRYGFRTLWASFGWGNVDPGIWVTFLFGGGLILAALGWMRDAWAGRILPQEGKLALFLLLMVGDLAALPVLRELVHRGWVLRGRYILAALALIGVLWARGMRPWIPPRREKGFAAFLLVGLLALNLYALWGVILPVYRPQGLLASAQARRLLEEGTFTPAYARYGRAVELQGFRLLTPSDPRRDTYPGTWVEVELLWHVLAPLEPNHSILLQILGRGDRTYGQTITYPAKGTYPTRLWQRDTWFRERYWIRVEPGGPLPTTAGIGVLLVLDEEPDVRPLPVYDAEGRPVHRVVRVGRFRLAARPRERIPLPAPLCLIDARVGSARLIGVTFPSRVPLGTPLPVDIHWRVIRSPGEEAIPFLHLETGDGRVLSTGDAPPQEGDFPTTFWQPGDAFIDPHMVPLPADLAPGSYILTVGIYRPDDGVRWPVWDPEARPVPSRQLTVARIDVDKGGTATLKCPDVGR